MERNFFISHEVFWNMKEVVSERDSESPIFSLYRIRWKLKLHKIPENNCYQRDRFEVHLIITDAPMNYLDVQFCVSWKWKHENCRISEKNTTRVIVSDLVSGKYSKICENSITDLRNFYENESYNSGHKSCDFSTCNLIFALSIRPEVDDYVSLGLQEQYTILSLPCADSLVEDMEEAFNNSEHADVILKCGDKNIPAHKAILACRSEVFQAMFRNDLKECQEGEVNITDIEASIFEQFICYIYTGDFCAKTVESMRDIYKAAHKYNVKALKERCIQFIKENLESHQACETLILADMYQESDLKMYVMTYIINRKDFLLSEEWLAFSKDYPYLAQDVFLLFVQKAEIKSTSDI